MPYEVAPRFTGDPQMKRGGLGPYAPGEYSDDTQMAVCIARVAATGGDLHPSRSARTACASALSRSRRSCCRTRP
ncbi:ADP-ribosylglycohydrolase family protein [Promicromonospora vindobonensis]|uniref:ADP-ribosylglycohydrolase family protein n=1 Tax=Promicromonospora vindobonensis TaxID=195748 RepID=A0ABW5VVH0_9MICO